MIWRDYELRIPAVTNKEITSYTKIYNSLDPSLEALMEQVNERTDVLPCIQRDTACYLQFLVTQEKPIKVLELGTSLGVSTLTMALVLPENGHITTIERGIAFAAEAQKNFMKFEMESKITQISGDVLQIVPKLEEEYDLIFQDSGKQTYLPLLDNLVKLLKPGGLLVVDDTLFAAMNLPERNRKSQLAMEEFNRSVYEHALLHSFILPIGHGLTIAQKTK